MKKLCLVLVLAAVPAFALTPLDQKVADLKARLAAFAAEKDAPAQVRRAVEAYDARASVQQALPPARTMDPFLAEVLTKDERESLAKVDATIERMIAQQEKLLGQLTKTDVETLTKGVPYAYPRAFERFGFWPNKDECDEASARAVIEAYGLESAAREKSLLPRMKMEYADRQWHRIHAKWKELLRSDARFARDTEVRTFLESWYPETSKLHRATLEQLKKDEAALRGIIGSKDTEAYVFAKAVRFPHCLAFPSLRFARFVNEEVARTRGRWLLQQMNLQAIRSAKVDAEALLRGVKAVAGSTVYGTRDDPWGAPYRFMNKEGRFILYSIGADAAPQTKDDVVIGELLLPPTN